LRQLVERIARVLLRPLRPTWVRQVLLSVGIDPHSPPIQCELPEGKRLLVLAPHPDDESIGCGGLIAKWLADGREALVVFLTNGAMGSQEARRAGGEGAQQRDAQSRLIELRRAEALQAMQALGGARSIFLDFPDGEVPKFLEGLAEQLAGIMRSFSPDVVALPFVADRHPDHRATTPMLLRAIALSGSVSPAIVFLAYEVWSPLQANVVVNISAEAESKAAAIRAYASQIAQRDYTDSALALNRYRACSSLTGAKYSEAFWMGDLRQLERLWAQARI
jgi:LmbE family N-acetylglucosaminyl deacetylase